MLCGGLYGVAHADTELDSFYNTDLRLEKSGSPYVVPNGGVYVAPDHTVTIDPGVEVRVGSGWFYVDGSTLIVGSSSSQEGVVMKSDSSSLWQGIYLLNATADMYALTINGAQTPVFAVNSSTTIKGAVIDGSGVTSGLERGLSFIGGTFDVATSTISNWGSMGIFAEDASGGIDRTIITRNRVGVLYSGNHIHNVRGRHNVFSENDISIQNVNQFTELDFRDNEWGTGGAPQEGSVIGRVITGYEPEIPCCSNVVFIPGFGGSRLHLGNNQLWEPNINADVKKLYMDENGQSLEQDVTVGEIIKKTNSYGPIGSFDVYQSFANTMDSLVSGGLIQSWKPLPYDWRNNIEEVAQGMVDSIEQVASSSKNKKVTIVAHSNGGLVAKALIKIFEEQGKSNLINELVLVAVPQVGTPESIGSLLHGDGQEKGLGFVISQKTARTFGEHVPSSYGLIPSGSYFDQSIDPVVKFNSTIDQLTAWRAAYGDSTDSKHMLNRFLLGAEGREKPSEDDLSQPNVLNEQHLSIADEMHQSLDGYRIPSSIKVSQVSGWGINTVSGIEYYASRHCGFTNFFCIGNTGLGLDHKALLTTDGDGIVVASSSVAMRGSNISTYYVNLYSENVNRGKNNSHAIILESPSVLNLITNIVKGSSTNPVAHVSTTTPKQSSISSLQISIHSPADIHAYDTQRRHTGIVYSSSTDLMIVEEQIPNSSYAMVGEGSYINVVGNSVKRVSLQGTGVGVFTLNVDKKVNGVMTSIEFVDIPVTDVTKAEVLVASNLSQSSLALDVEGDGKVDNVIKPQKECDAILYLEILKKQIYLLKLKPSVEARVIAKIDKTIKALTKEKVKVATKRLSRFGLQLNTKKWSIKHLSESNRNEILKSIDETLDLLTN